MKKEELLESGKKSAETKGEEPVDTIRRMNPGERILTGAELAMLLQGNSGGSKKEGEKN